MRRVVLLASLAAVSGAFACTGVYVGRRASATGHAMIARSVDTPPVTRMFRTVLTPRVENAPGREIKGFHGFRWPLPATTWKYVSTPSTTSGKFGDFPSLGVNEKGLTVSAMVTGYAHERSRKADPFVKTGLSEDSMAALYAATCVTARDVVELTAEVMSKAGGREGMIVMAADKAEAWLIETYSGHEWAAVRLPEDGVAGFGNEFGIRSFTPGAEGTRASENLISHARRQGFLVTNKDGSFDLAKTYGAPRCDFAHVRTWFCRRQFLGEKAAGAYDRQSANPLCSAPDHKITREEVFELFRSRGEGTAWCPESTGRQDTRVIGDESQCTTHLVEIREDLADEAAGVAWISLGAAEHSVFLPITAAATSTDAAFARDSRPDAAANAYEPELAAAAFRRLSALAELNRVLYGQGVRDYWRRCEAHLATLDPSALAGDGAARIQAAAFKDARTLFDQLMWHIAGENSARRYANNYHTGVLTPFAPRRPFAPDLAALELYRFKEGK